MLKIPPPRLFVSFTFAKLLGCFVGFDSLCFHRKDLFHYIFMRMYAHLHARAGARTNIIMCPFEFGLLKSL